MTLVPVIEYALKHPKREQVFPGWSDIQICEEIVRAGWTNGLLVITNSNSEVVLGFCSAQLDFCQRKLKVISVLSSTKGVFKRMLDYFKKKFPTWIIEARRGKKNRTYYYDFYNHRISHS